ncbi:MAG: HAMP domain-containing histidine kinase [Candidatus Cloacimonetes bacterium]|nr:HAMP domain-containing histidine kinase [Candidatus Cloacimonadota bacterium]
MRRSTAFRKRRRQPYDCDSGQPLVPEKEGSISQHPAKSDFIANISHEIRTPMNAIMGFAQMLQGTNLSPQQQDYVSVILDSGKKLLLIINNLLDLSNLQTGKMTLNPISCKPLETAGKLWDHYRPQILAKNLKPVLDCEKDIPELYFDCEKLERILGYLLSNALKYTSKGFISLKMSLRKGRDNGLFLFLEVADSGIGIAPELLPYIFEDFEQADNSITRPYEGLGIGLSLAKQTVTLMGGKIWCLSTPGQGSQFFIEVPTMPAKGEQLWP